MMHTDLDITCEQPICKKFEASLRFYAHCFGGCLTIRPKSLTMAVHCQAHRSTFFRCACVVIIHFCRKNKTCLFCLCIWCLMAIRYVNAWKMVYGYTSQMNCVCVLRTSHKNLILQTSIGRINHWYNMWNETDTYFRPRSI